MPAPLTPQAIERWNRVLAAAAKLQSVILEAFLVGGTVVGIYVPCQPTYCGTNVHSFHEGGLVMISGPGMKPVVAHVLTELDFPRMN